MNFLQTARRSCGLAIAALGVTAAASAADDVPRRPEALPDTYIPKPPADDSLYRALGGHDGIDRLVADFRQRLLDDPILRPYFQDGDGPRLLKQLALMFCEVSGGPCRQAEHSTRRVHSGTDINRASFNAVVEKLQDALDAAGVPFSVQNRLLAQLAPMHRDIVNVP